MSSRLEGAPEALDQPRGAAESDRREMSAGAHFAGLDGYRAVAALMVVLTHVAFSTGVVVTAGTWGHLLGRLDFGVALFFLMSGFLLYRPWARAAFDATPRPSLRRYAIRRAARILPLYWVVVVVTLLVLPEIQPVGTDQWWKHLLALQIYLPGGAIEGLSQTWSLCTEISFYVALPVLAVLAGSGRGRDPWRRQVVLLATLVVVATTYNAVNAFTDACRSTRATGSPPTSTGSPPGCCSRSSRSGPTPRTGPGWCPGPWPPVATRRPASDWPPGCSCSR